MSLLDFAMDVIFIWFTSYFDKYLSDNKVSRLPLTMKKETKLKICFTTMCPLFAITLFFLTVNLDNI